MKKVTTSIIAILALASALNAQCVEALEENTLTKTTIQPVSTKIVTKKVTSTSVEECNDAQKPVTSFKGSTSQVAPGCENEEMGVHY